MWCNPPSTGSAAIFGHACRGRGLASPHGAAWPNERCITKLENAHGTESRELLYRWPPWAGLSVGVHESVEKPDGVVFRCSVRGRRLEIPAWMFDRSACARCVLQLMPMST